MLRKYSPTITIARSAILILHSGNTIGSIMSVVGSNTAIKGILKKVEKIKEEGDNSTVLNTLSECLPSANIETIINVFKQDDIGEIIKNLI